MYGLRALKPFSCSTKHKWNYFLNDDIFLFSLLNQNQCPWPCGKQRFEIRVESGKLRCNEKGELTFNLHLKVQNKSCIGIDGQKNCTLTCQIIVQEHLIVQVADFSEINKLVHKDWPGKKVTVYFPIFYLVRSSENILFFYLHFT